MNEMMIVAGIPEEEMEAFARELVREYFKAQHQAERNDLRDTKSRSRTKKPLKRLKSKP